jgi:predicted RNA-binding protein (virulence factor B family)
MAEPGQICTLRVARVGARSVFLDGGELGEIMLAPTTDREIEVGSQLEVFVYVDADGSLMASTRLPVVVAGQVACLQVVALTGSGAFLDWGMHADLFVPRSEQIGDMRIGSKCVVLTMLDEQTNRMIATARLYQYLPDENDGRFKQHQQVSLLVCQRTELGFKVVIDGTHLGMLYHNEIFTAVQVGDQLQGYMKAARPDGKLDAALQKAGRHKHSAAEEDIIEHLKANNGVSAVTDKSAPEEIYRTFGISKKAYKQALGALYKARRIVVAKDQISLTDKN